MRTIAAASVALAVLAAGCTSKTSAPDVAAFQALAADTQARVARYQAAWAATPATDAASCLAIEDTYHADVKPMLQRMAGMSPGMDDWMDSHGMAAGADMGCGSTVMMDELEGHHAVACQGTALQNSAEAARHVGAMTYDTNHLLERAGQMADMMDGGMMGGGMMDAGAPMTGCFRAGGGFQTDAGYWSDGGWMMDGGAMGDGGMVGDGGM
jgi:hypothetical protein